MAANLVNSNPVLKLTPHPGQLEVMNSTAKFTLIRAGRRWGKTKLGQALAIIWCLCWQDMIARTGWFMDNPWEVGHKPVNLVVMPTAVMARQIWFESLYAILCHHPLVDSINKTSMTFQFKGDRPDLLIRGANDSDGDRLRGLKVLSLFCDEVQDVRQPVIDRVLIPAMSDLPFSQAYMTGTPKGKHNIFYRLWQRYQGNVTRQRNFYYKTEDNPYFPVTELSEYQLILPPSVYREEYEATWEDVPGAFFPTMNDNNLTDELPPYFEEVRLGVDAGDLNPAHVVLCRYKDVWFFTEGWQPNNTSFTDGEHTFKSVPIPESEQNESLKRLAKDWGVGATFVDPSRPARILDIRIVGKVEGLIGLQRTVAGYNRFLDGVGQLNNLLHNRKLLFFTGQLPGRNRMDGRTLYDLFASYHRKLGKDGTPIDEEAPGQNTHSIDAVRYALAAKSGHSS